MLLFSLILPIAIVMPTIYSNAYIIKKINQSTSNLLATKAPLIFYFFFQTRDLKMILLSSLLSLQICYQRFAYTGAVPIFLRETSFCYGIKQNVWHCEDDWCPHYACYQLAPFFFFFFSQCHFIYNLPATKMKFTVLDC